MATHLVVVLDSRPTFERYHGDDPSAPHDGQAVVVGVGRCPEVRRVPNPVDSDGDHVATA